MLIVSEILLQQTRAETVADFLGAFRERFPNWASIDEANLSRLEEALKPIGLWRRRAISLKGLAGCLKARRWRWPTSREELEEMPAVGQYVASAVMLFVHGKPEPLLDGNMARVMERYFGPRQKVDIRRDEYLQRLCRRVLSEGNAKETNWAILDLAAKICKARVPLCTACPLKDTCLYARKSFSDTSNESAE